MEHEIERSKELKEKFLKLCNSKPNKDEYYYVIMDIDFDSYDYIFLETKDIYIDVTRYGNIRKTGLFGKTYTVKGEYSIREKVGIYAVKYKDGIYEMTTGKKLTVNSDDNSLHCLGVYSIGDTGLDQVSRDLKLLDSNPKYKEQYINQLLLLSNRALNKQKMFEEVQRKKESNLQYLRTYRYNHNLDKD